MDPLYFGSPAELRAWLEGHHEAEAELSVGFWRTGSGQPSLTWAEAVDEALCFGWIDGVRRRVDESRYTIRFTPRRPRSTWSAVNVRRVAELTAAGRMHPAGLAAFERRAEDSTAVYSYEQRPHELDGVFAELFRENDGAWAFFQAQPPSYRRTAIWWVVSAKKEETRLRRLATLIDDSAHGFRLAMLRRRDAP